MEKMPRGVLRAPFAVIGLLALAVSAACGAPPADDPAPVSKVEKVEVHLTYDAAAEDITCDVAAGTTAAASWVEEVAPSVATGPTPEHVNDQACRQAVKTAKSDKSLTAALDALKAASKVRAEAEKATEGNEPLAEVAALTEAVDELEKVLVVSWDSLQQPTGAVVKATEALEQVLEELKEEQNQPDETPKPETPTKEDGAAKDKDTTPKNVAPVTPKNETPKKEAPKKPAPQNPAPKKDTPKKDAPKPKKPAPKKDTPKPKKPAPKKDTPKKDAPKPKKPAPKSDKPNNPKPTPKPKPKPEPTSTRLPERQTGAMLASVNKKRAAVGVPALVRSACAEQQALNHAQYMAKTGKYDHQDLYKVGDACNSDSWIGENIAMGQSTTASVLDAWYKSPGHYQNIVSPNYVSFGAAVAYSPAGTPFWVQVFL